MSKEKKEPTIRELFASSAGVHFRSQWNDDKILHVDHEGVIRCGKPGGPVPKCEKLIRAARETGTIEGMPNEAYHRERQHVSSSALKVFQKNPREYYHEYVSQETEPDEGAPEESAAKRVGSLTHSMLLDSEEDMARLYDFYPVEIGGLEINRKLKDHKAYLATLEVQAKEAGQTLVTMGEWEAAESLAAAARSDAIINGMLDFDGAVKELSGFTFDKQTGVRIKARFDLICRYTGPKIETEALSLTPGELIIPDIKTSESQSPDQFCVRDVVNFGYHLSGALYLRVIENILGVRPKFIWAVLSKDKRGYCQSFPVTLHQDDWESADLEVGRLLGNLSMSRLGGEFVSPYTGRINIGRLPHYLRYK